MYIKISPSKYQKFYIKSLIFFININLTFQFFKIFIQMLIFFFFKLLYLKYL